MECPACRSGRNKVIRTTVHKFHVRRRRECVCGVRYSTVEKATSKETATNSAKTSHSRH